MSSGLRYLQDGQLSSLLLRTEAERAVKLSARCRGGGELKGVVSCARGGWDKIGDGKKLSELAEGVTFGGLTPKIISIIIISMSIDLLFFPHA